MDMSRLIEAGQLLVKLVGLNSILAYFMYESVP